MKQAFFIITIIILLFACRTSHSLNKAREKLVGKYKMEIVLTEEELKQNPETQALMNQMILTTDLRPDGRGFMRADFMGQIKNDTIDWNVKGDCLIIISDGKREAALMTKCKGGFKVTQKSSEENMMTLKFTKLK